MMPALSQREQDGAAGLADHGVGLPVAGAGAFLDNLRPLVNRNPAPDLAPAVIAPVAFPAPLLATQAGLEITATALVRIDILVPKSCNCTFRLYFSCPIASSYCNTCCEQVRTLPSCWC